jgi:hypothetical protein
VVSVAVVAAVTAGYFGLRHDSALGDAAGGPPARTGAAMAYDSATGDMVMFGGTSATGQPLADTWLWDGSGWAQASPATSPPARYGAQMAWDPQSQRVILLGGTGGSGCSVDGSSGVAVPGSAGSGSATTGSASATTGSGSATAAPASAIATQASAIATPASAIAAPPSATASSGACTQLQDAWAWDGSDWSRLALGQASGQLGHYSLAGASMATDASTGRIVLVTAGSPATEIGPIPAIYGSSGGSATGAASSGSATGLPASSAAAVTANPGGPCIAVGGGLCGSPVAVPTVPATTLPGPTACPLDGGCALLPCSGCVICPMTSGSTTPGAGTQVICSNCVEIGTPCPLLPATLTWVFDGTTFQPVSASPTEVPPSGGQLVWFPGPGLLVDLGSGLYAAMGGTAIACPYDAPCPVIPAREEYRWTGTGWTPLQDAAASASEPYFEVPPVADTATGEAVGLDAMGVTWVSTDPATGWAKALSAAAPTARSDFALAYDGATGEVVLFGGDAFGASSATGGVTADTWTWDSSGWTLRGGATPTPIPSPSGTASPVASPVTLPSLPAVPPATPVPTAVSLPSPTPTVPATETPTPSPAATT